MVAPYRTSTGPPARVSHDVFAAGVRATLLGAVIIVIPPLSMFSALAVLYQFMELPVAGMYLPECLPFLAVITIVRPLRMAFRALRLKVRNDIVPEPVWSIVFGASFPCLIIGSVLWEYGKMWDLPRQCGAWLHRVM